MTDGRTTHATASIGHVSSRVLAAGDRALFRPLAGTRRRHVDFLRVDSTLCHA
ncbi:hypothetical protein [Nigerium sp.]|uniref:hypothetical protein n=1 Tax=Nigerium sp. TaxID=2042655 RepID=UPI003221F7A5